MTGAIPGNLMTTAMAVMPHADPSRALEVSLPVDVPFRPQLPLSPATCCLVNPDGEIKVERAFAAVNRVSTVPRDKYL